MKIVSSNETVMNKMGQIHLHASSLYEVVTTNGDVVKRMYSKCRHNVYYFHDEHGVGIYSYDRYTLCKRVK